MSRICVKNLPKYVAEDRLREFFSQKGEVTDAKLLRTPDGKSRQFAFVGFRTEQEANEAIKYFNRSYLDTFRITCELARKIGDPDTPRPWSRHSMKKQEKLGKEDDKVTSSKNTKIKESKVDKKHSVEENENDDPLLQEFLQVMQPRSKSKMWANDTIELQVNQLWQWRISSCKKLHDLSNRPRIKGRTEGVLVGRVGSSRCRAW